MVASSASFSIQSMHGDIFTKSPLKTVDGDCIISENSFDIQRFADSGEKTGIWVVKTLIKLTATYELNKLVKELNESKEDLHKFLKNNVNPLFNFIATFWNAESGEKTNSTLLNAASVFSNFVNIINDADDILKETEKSTPNLKNINTSIGSAAKNLINLSTSIAKLNSDKAKPILSIVTAGLGIVCSQLVLIDGVEEKEKESLNKAYIGLLKCVSKEILKKVFQTENVSQFFEKKGLANIATTFTKGGGPLDLIFAALTGIMNGWDEYFERRDQYIAEEIPEDIAKHDAVIDAIAKFVYETAHSYTKGLDDVIYNSVGSFVSWLTQTDTSLDERNYIEVIADLFKTLNYKNSGNKKDNDLLNDQHNTYVYGNYGNDVIKNFVPKATIWGGYGNDTISNFNSTNRNSDYNSILGGPGDDMIIVRSNHNMVCGGIGKDGFYIVAGDNTVNGGLGDDTVVINIPDSSISGSNSVSIEYAEGDGCDTIVGFGSNDTLHITKGAYSTVRSNSDVIVNVGDGFINLKNVADTSIKIFCDNAVNGTSGNDSIVNNYTEGHGNVIIYGLSGNDFIDNWRKNVTIKAGSGNDFIKNYDSTNTFGRVKSFVLIDGEDGADVIENKNHFLEDNITILGGAGDDSISSYSEGSTTIEGGLGNDTINLSRHSFWGNHVVKYAVGDGNDIIYANSTDTLYITKGTISDSVITTGSCNKDLILTIGESKVTLEDAFSTTFNIKLADGSVSKIVCDNVINGTSGNDSIVNNYTEGHGNAIIYGLSGNDFIDNSCKNVTIRAGSGNDFIRNKDNFNSGNSSHVLIDGEDGSDIIENTNQLQKNNITILGGAGDDSINSYSQCTTIEGGKGNDTITFNKFLSPFFGNNVVKYTTGDGDDTIINFNYDNTLQIAGSYTTQKSGSDLIVKVGTGSITLKNVSSANIEKLEGTANQITWTASGTTATGKIDGKVVAKITGLKKGFKAGALSGVGNEVVIANSALTTTKAAISGTGDYTLALGENVTKADVVEAGWTIDGTSATYTTEDSTVGHYVAANGKSIVYKKAKTGKELTKIEGLSKNVIADDLTLNGKVVTVKAHALGTDEATISNGYTFKLDTDVTKSTTKKAFWTIDDDSAEYTTAKVTEGYVLSKDKKSITHNEAGGGEAVATIDGLKKGTKSSSFSVKNNVITVANTALNPKNIITLDSEDYTLAIGSGAKKSITSPEGWYISGTTASYNTEKTIAGYALFDDSKTIEYISEVDGGDTLVKLTGLKARTKATALSIEKKVVTIGEDAINVKTAMTATAEGYEIKLSSAGKITAKSENMTLTGSSGNDTLLGSKYADVLKGGTGEDYLSGGNGADKIYGDGDDTLIGGLGKDSLYSTAGDNTLTGGSGADEFYFKAGNAIITDYTAGKDKIYLQGTSITKTEVSGKNVVFTTSTGAITVKNGKNKKITVVDSKGKTTTETYGKATSANIAELWFMSDETTFSTSFAQIDSITRSGLSDYSLGNIDAATEWTALTPKDSLTSYLTSSKN